jgi:AraC-like DNA-binding protein
MQHDGLDVSPGDIILNNSDVLHQRTGAGFRIGGMSLPTGEFEVAYRAITGGEFAASHLTHLALPSPTLMSRLLRLHETVGQIAKTAPDLLELPEVVRSLEQRLIHLMVRCLADGAFSGMTACSRRHDAIVARFEEFLGANPDTPLYMIEICAAIGVAERTLRAACEEHLGMGPIRYLSLRRMHLVRRALLSADPSTATVTRLATDYGFWELGRFSVAYRALFDESPSESLRRAADVWPAFVNRPSSLERHLHS